jgi:hypothetical protein
MRPGSRASFGSLGRPLRFFSSAAFCPNEVGSHVIIVREQIQNPASLFSIFSAVGLRRLRVRKSNRFFLIFLEFPQKPGI